MEPSQDELPLQHLFPEPRVLQLCELHLPGWQIAAANAETNLRLNKNTHRVSRKRRMRISHLGVWLCRRDFDLAEPLGIPMIVARHMLLCFVFKLVLLDLVHAAIARYKKSTDLLS